MEATHVDAVDDRPTLIGLGESSADVLRFIQRFGSRWLDTHWPHVFFVADQAQRHPTQFLLHWSDISPKRIEMYCEDSFLGFEQKYRCCHDMTHWEFSINTRFASLGEQMIDILKIHKRW